MTTKTKKTAKKKTKRTPQPTRRRLSREEWEALLLGPEPTTRQAIRIDDDVATELGVTRQAIQAVRARLGIEACVPGGGWRREIETPAVDATLHAIAGWRIRLHRVRLGWRIGDLVHALGGSWAEEAISKLELWRPGRPGLTPETLHGFADALEVSPADLLLLPGQVAMAPALDFYGGAAAAAEGAWVEMVAAERPELRRVIGVNVARWRCWRGLTQVDLAARISWTQGRISTVEHGRRGQHSPGITFAGIAVFATALEVTPADLVRLPRQPALVPVESG